MTILGSLFGLPQSFFASASVPGAAPAPEQQLPTDSPFAPRRDAAASEPQGPSAPAAASASSSVGSRPAASGWRESGATCLTCGIGVGCPGFASPQEQRQHFKTDWHRYNVKRRLAKQPAVSEEQFEKVLEQGTEMSISGSESETDEEDEEDAIDEEGPVPGEGALGPRQFRKKGAPAPAPSAIPRETFQAADGSPFSVWRCLLRQDHVKAAADQPSGPQELLGELRRLRAAAGKWVVVLLRGGHFAATVFKAREGRAANPGKHDADGLEGFDVVAHKTFHRYVVRAKAGGKQSSKDATGKFARSAGSRLRRYNEQALERDVQELLASWSDHIASADLLFAHAPASNARSLFSEGQTTLLQSNPRLRRVPFVTHRPTFSETKRVLRLLTAVFKPEDAELLLQQQQSVHLEEEAAAEAEALAASQQQQQQQQATSTSKKDKQQAADAGEADEAAEPGPGSAAAAAAASSEGPLHRAAKAGDPERVRRLLESGHDPCARDGKGRAPYALAADKNTRDAFRRFMAQHPDRWDYSTSGIPSALTEEMEAAAAAKKAAHKAKLKAKDSERKEGSAAGPSAEERKKAAEEAAAAAKRAAVEDEIAAALAEANAMAARMNISAKQPASSSGRGAGGAGGSKVGGGGGGGSAAGGGKAGGKAGAGKAGGKAAAAAAAAAAAPPTPEELARRREMMAAAAEARMRALSQAQQQQKLY